jgi:hypothetical protein
MEEAMTRSAARAYTRGGLKILTVSVMVAIQCATVTPGVRGQGQNPLSVDIPSLAGKSMDAIYQQFKSSKKKCKEVDKEFLARAPPDSPPFDDLCAFKVGGGRLHVFAYRGRAFAFQYYFGLNAAIEPEEALRRVGINVDRVKPRIEEDPPEVIRYHIWSGTFNEKSWKEVRVMQLLKMKERCPLIVALLSDKTE